MAADGYLKTVIFTLDHKMKMKIALLISWIITVLCIVVLLLAREHFIHQNSALRNLRADLWRHQDQTKQCLRKIVQETAGMPEAKRESIRLLVLEEDDRISELQEKNLLRRGDVSLDDLRKDD